MNWFKYLLKGSTTAMSPNDPKAVRGAGVSPDALAPDAQQTLGLAHDAAKRLGHYFIGTEHVLLGLIGVKEGKAFLMLVKMGISPEKVRAEIERAVGEGPDKSEARVSYTPRTKKVMAIAAKEAKALGAARIDTDVLLLALLLEGDGIAARILLNLGANILSLRRAIADQLHPELAAQWKEHAEPTPEPAPPNELSSTMLDFTWRYDICCLEGTQVVTYKNVLFKGYGGFFETSRRPQVHPDFLEIEQADGKTIFIAKSTIIKFCEHRSDGPSSGGEPSV
jgi:ClpA/ClpB-like protein